MFWPFKKKEYIVVQFAYGYVKVPVQKDKNGKEYAHYLGAYWIKDEEFNHWKRYYSDVLPLKL